MRISSVVLISVGMMLTVIGVAASPIAGASIEKNQEGEDITGKQGNQEGEDIIGKRGNQEGEDIIGKRGNQEEEDIIGKRGNQEGEDTTKNEHLGRIVEYRILLGGAHNLSVPCAASDNIHEFEHVLSLRHGITVI
ncbi:hypothetical protein EV424DRAFT_1556766 [Suillus variegatus]|nr:hypothetical protein EV424DRAFT_1556766 [Suillus variegatus]